MSPEPSTGTLTPAAFALGAALLAERWTAAASGASEADASRSNRTRARWVPDPDRDPSGGFGFLEVESDDPRGFLYRLRRRRTNAEEGVTEDAEEDAEEDAAVRADEEAASARPHPPDAYLRSYRVAYSPAYGTPLLLASGRFAAPPREALTHAEIAEELETSARDRNAAKDSGSGGDHAGDDATSGGLLDAAPIPFDSDAGEDDERRRRREGAVCSGSFSAEVSPGLGLGPLGVFAPCADHPHASRGCWVVAHPCETASVMKLLLATVYEEVPPWRGGEGAGEEAERAARYLEAWARHVAASVAPDLRVPPVLR
jgi:hypothetical protein